MTHPPRPVKSGRGKPNPGRLAALQALLAVDGGEHADRALGPQAGLEPQNRTLAWRLLRGVLQRRRELDAVIQTHSRRPLSRLDPVPLNALRLGIYELCYSRVPPHAAVNEAVLLCRARGAAHAAGFVNAVLRKVQPPCQASERDLLNHPDWLLDRWQARYGGPAAKGWAELNNQPPLLSLAFAPGSVDAQQALLAAGHSLQAARAAGEDVPHVFLLQDPGSVVDLPGFAEGAWWVQDPAAAYVADLVAAEPGWFVLDACAAPGGKSFRLAHTGAQVTAVDRVPQRLERLREGAERLNLPLTIMQHDWESGAAWPGPDFDAVLVDAPCSGLGTLRRHPEIRWKLQPDQLPRLAERQLTVLFAAAKVVRPGGCLVYAVCSGEPEEGRGVLGAFQRLQPHFNLDRVWTSAPPVGDEDGFWAARLLRQPGRSSAHGADS